MNLLIKVKEEGMSTTDEVRVLIVKMKAGMTLSEKVTYIIHQELRTSYTRKILVLLQH